MDLRGGQQLPVTILGVLVGVACGFFLATYSLQTWDFSDTCERSQVVHHEELYVEELPCPSCPSAEIIGLDTTTTPLSEDERWRWISRGKLLSQNHTSSEIRCLEVTLSSVASPRNEVLVTMADRNVKQQLWLWHQGIMLSNVTNVMVLALDEETWQFAKRELSLASCVLRGASTQPSTFQNAHEMSSAKKYRLLQRIVRLGYHVLLSDTDVALLDDPFLHLHRDADVECSTDGWSDLTAYGWSSRTKDPPLFPPWKHSMSHLNAGFFFLQANPRTDHLLEVRGYF